MTIHLPIDLENSIRAEVVDGHFGSIDEAMAEAARLLLRQRRQMSPLLNRAATEADFRQRLLESGLIVSLPTPDDPELRSTFQPVTLEGEPVSETIIRERR